MLQDEHLRAVVGANIPAAFHPDLDLLARWVRGRRWVEAESDLILDVMVEFLEIPRLTVADAYVRLSRRMEIMGDCDDRDYAIPSFHDFAHLLKSLPDELMRICREDGGTDAHESDNGWDAAEDGVRNAA